MAKSNWFKERLNKSEEDARALALGIARSKTGSEGSEKQSNNENQNASSKRKPNWFKGRLNKSEKDARALALGIAGSKAGVRPEGSGGVKASGQYKQTGNNEDNFSRKLKVAQKKNPLGEAKQMADTAKTLAKVATPMGAFSLARQINLTHDLFIFTPMFIAAIFKDILDIAVIGSLPAIGTVIGVCISIFIFFMMLLAGAKGKLAKGIVKKGLTLIGGTGAEMLFGLNFLPIQTATVVVIYIMTLAERKNEAKN